MHSYSFYHMNLIHPSQPSHLNLTVKKTNSVTALTAMLKHRCVQGIRSPSLLSTRAECRLMMV
jgi:hypothetical protein